MSYSEEMEIKSDRVGGVSVKDSKGEEECGFDPLGLHMWCPLVYTNDLQRVWISTDKEMKN